MITLNLKIDDKTQKVNIKEDVIFNSILSEHIDMIKYLMSSISPSYQVHESFFKIVNRFVDFNEDFISIYPGLIVQTGFDRFAILFLEGTKINEEYAISLIKEFIYDMGNHNPREIEIDQFEVTKEAFLNASEKF